MALAQVAPDRVAELLGSAPPESCANPCGSDECNVAAAPATNAFDGLGENPSNDEKRKVARAMLEQMREAQVAISEQGKFESSQTKARVLDVYADAAAKLRKHHVALSE